ncbi:RNA-directed DNA polymerase from mobile element jockey [Stomoxys calcitrans]|uniref:RNA-directed DNA polymerase from mobile element jockey n=1 Tax=Stomoxys calcitrans TaxID=35570 RepID=UPI0027E37A00|nr:RNA-directed DNA polymerase from mobile element jockey [Stomoxys calcitrans]
MFLLYTMIMKICQYNVQSFSANKNYLEFYCNQYDIDVIALSEIFSERKENTNKLVEFNLVQKYRPDGYGGVAIGLKKFIRFSKVRYDTNYDIVIVRTSNLSKNLCLVSAYFPPSISTKDMCDEIERLLIFLDNMSNIIIMGDFNARNTSWGDSITTRKGSELERLMFSSNLKCANNGKATFRRNLESTGSVLDLTFVSMNLDVNWMVCDYYLGGSRHFPISIEVELSPKTPQRFLCRNKLLSSLGKVKLEPDFEFIEQTFSLEIVDATFSPKEGRHPKYWWNDHLLTLFRRQMAAMKKARRNPTYLNLESSRRHIEIWKNEVAKAKRESFKQKIAEVNASTNARETWKFINSVKNRGQPPKTVWSYDNNLEYLNLLKSQVPYSQCHYDYHLDFLSNDEHISFSMTDFEKCLEGKRKNSAGGADGITYAMIRALSDKSKENLLTAMNKAFCENLIRDSWRVIKIVPIPKPNKDHNDIANFRPISLISVILKCMNLMIKDKLLDYFQANDIIPHRSFAYRKNYSTASCLNEFLHRVAILKNNNLKVLVLSLDISNAYNCVNVGIMYNMLAELGVNKSICSWVRNFLSERVLKLGNAEVTVRDGLPQGSCLSPTLFNIYTAGLHSVEDSNTMLFQYADDFILMSFDYDFDWALNNLCRKTSQFKEICSSLNLSFNPSKCSTMYFAKNSVKEIKLIVDGNQIVQVRKLKFLGRVITNSLTVKDHYDHLAPSVKNRSNMIKCLTPLNGGFHPKLALNTYKGLVRAKIEYARTSTAHSPAYINKHIEVLQNDILRKCLGVTRSTPTHVIYALADEMPPKQRAKFLTAKELMRVHMHNPTLYDIISDNPRVKSSYSNIYYEFKNIFDNIKVGTNYALQKSLKVRLNLLPSRKSDTPDEVIRSVYCREIAYYRDNDFEIFATDASVANASTGCGVYNASKDHRYLFKIDFRSSSMFGELWALLKALEIAVEDKVVSCVLFTDSLSACRALISKGTSNYVVGVFHNLLNSSKIDCHVVWLPSHRGIGINEEADYLAKMASYCGAPLKPE